MLNIPRFRVDGIGRSEGEEREDGGQLLYLSIYLFIFFLKGIGSHQKRKVTGFSTIGTGGTCTYNPCHPPLPTNRGKVYG